LTINISARLCKTQRLLQRIEQTAQEASGPGTTAVLAANASRLFLLNRTAQGIHFDIAKKKI